MDYQQAFAEHYKAVRARIANSKPKAEPLPVEITPEPEPPQEERRHSDPRMQILRECAKEYGCTVQEILSASRFANVINARHKAMWRLYQRGTMSLVQIGRYIKKDHATVLHAIRKHEKSLAQGEAK